MVDSHVHTPLCGHAEGHPEAYLEEARAKGLKGVVFTDRIAPLRRQLLKSKLLNLAKGKYRCAYKTR